MSLKRPAAGGESCHSRIRSCFRRSKEDRMEAAGTIKNFLWTGRIEQRRKLWKALFYKEKREKRTKSEAMESVAGVPASTEKHIDKIGRI